MKRNLIGILSLVVMSVMLNATANAQALAKANVPFAFKVGSAELPAGNYEIQEVNSGAIVIQNRQAHRCAVSAVRPEYPRKTGTKLVFHLVAGQYFLAEIWRGAGSTGMVIPRSKQEKNLERELQLASGQSTGGEEVMIALY
ncbi:MAG: hypothetical protein WB660_11050 [Candidatus Sulfotelmatobacter sp.]